MSSLVPNFDVLLYGLVTTIQTSVTTLILSTVFGALLAVGRMVRGSLLDWVVKAYVGLFQNIPYLLVVFFVFYGLGSFGVLLDAAPAVVLGLTAYSAAYICEAIYSGMLAIEEGQVEAARSTGLSNTQIGTKIVLPLGVTYALPALSNQWVRVIKNTTVLSIIGGGGLLYEVSQLASITFDVFTYYGIAAVVYWTLITLVTRVVESIEGRIRWRSRATNSDYIPVYAPTWLRRRQQAKVGA